MLSQNYDMITILGPTACGKTAIASRLAYNIDGEIISADSRQVYKEMNLGTGKDYSDYLVNNRQIPYHLIDILEPGEKYNVFEYQKDFLDVFNTIKKRAKFPILCGGTGMYIDAVTKGYKLLPVPKNDRLREKLEKKNLDELTKILSRYKKLHNTTDIDTKKRALRAIEIEEFYYNNKSEVVSFPKINTLFIGIKYERDIVRKRITDRLYERLKSGMIEEVEHLMKKGLSKEDLIYYGLEYKYITNYLIGKMDYENMVSKLNIAIHQFSKRQMTWFRKMEREGVKIHWLDGEMGLEEKVVWIKDLLNFVY